MSSPRSPLRVAFAALAACGCGALVDVPSFTEGPHVGADGSCEPGFANCNGDPDDGCEADLRGDEHCGSCDTACANGTCTTDAGGTASCQCLPGYAACAGDGACVNDIGSDPKNCGACGRDCSPGACDDGQCAAGLVISAAMTEGRSFAVAGGSLYFIAIGGIASAPIDVTTLAPLAPLVVHTAQPVVCFSAFGERLAWVENDVAHEEEIWTSALDGSGQTRLASGQNVINTPIADARPITLDATYAYWITYDDSDPMGETSTLNRARLDGTPPIETFGTVPGGSGTVAVSATDIYWITGADSLYIQPLASPSSVTVVPLGGFNQLLAVHGATACTVAFTPNAPSMLQVFCGQGSDASTFGSAFGFAWTSATGLDFDEKRLYLGDAQDGRIVATHRSPSVVAQTPGPASNLVVGGDSLFWVSEPGIYRLRHVVGDP